MEKVRRYSLVLIVSALIMGLMGCELKTSAGSNGEQNFPNHPMEVVIPFGEGGASDTFARKFTDIINETSPEPLQAINKGGSGGLVGMIYAEKQANDGYTVLEVTPSHVISDVLERGKGVELQQDFEPLVRIQSDIYILSVPIDSKINNFEELIESSKENTLTFGGISPGGLDDLTLKALAEETGMKVKFIPYKSGSEVKAAVLGGEVDVYLDKIISSIGYIKDKKVKPLVVLNDERISKVDELRDVPTTKELGYDTTIGSWRGFVVEKGTPEYAKEFYINQMKEAYSTDEYQQFAEKNLVDIREGFLGPEEFKQQWEEEYQTFTKVAKETGLK
ncbi:Bug family tripartite tricarboxylate transporter substrate binding protein [Halobacillus mangrovi]|uniref:Tripartite tricarboxylate transporter substrate binding protein n=1 Tax=Halobacillus mangrovi TaxID=402384 RepID=A0A1W5ZZV6_9BACI|nr:tripartite tricarboxylate transporter substrate binding protein [Halobacillus mangrovi]ARI78790.1 hypothetical protein HM131_18960 [Halobacillus mangrovi]